jgi:enediyne biosynthesis protein E4
LFLTNGAVNILEGQRGQKVPYRQRSQLFHNEGGGRFREVSAEAGPFFEQLLVGRGVAFGDLDNDGDVDMVVTTNDGPAIVLLNQTCAPGRPAAPGGHWIEITLRSQDGRRVITGARVGVVREGQPTLWRRARTDGSYLSASDARVHVGLGDQQHIDHIVVQWPDGVAESFTDVPADRLVTLTRGAGHAEAPKR